jgi:transposase
MRGKTDQQTSLLVLHPQDMIPTHHPIRRIKPIVDAVLRELSPLFEEMYDEGGRASVPPEHLLKASVLMSLYSVRSERQFCERPRYDLLFKWFLDLNIGDEGFDHSTFSKNRNGLVPLGEAGRLGQVHVDD